MTRPDRSDIEAAARRIADTIRRTPVLTLSPADTGLSTELVLKLELLQHSGSFKARGALNSIATLSTGVDGVCAASGGNHAGAVAWAAERSGLSADVFVPVTAPAAKVARIEEYGGRVHLVDGLVRDALEECLRYSESRGVPLVHPYDTVETVSGAGTLGLELLEQVPELGTVVVGCGGGGLYAGVANALHDVAAVLPVEPELCPTLARALEAGRPVDTPVGGVAVDSLGASRIGEIAFSTATAAGVKPVLVADDAIVETRRFLWTRLRVLAEPGACVALAAVLSGRLDIAGRGAVAVVLSGGNNDSVPR